MSMIKLELSDEECGALQDALSAYVSDTRMESPIPTARSFASS